MTLESLIEIITKLEGEYKWYVLSAVVLLLGVFFTQTIFKTIKWFILLLLLGALIVGSFYFFSLGTGL